MDSADLGHLTDPERSDVAVVVSYHERTKHHYHRHAASLGYLDWATQPDPFRRYHDAPLVRLPLPAMGRELPYWRLYVADGLVTASVTSDSISLFFRYALSLTAWKQVGQASWSLRANPSSGNLHPTEGYALLPTIAGIGNSPAVYHYAPREHGLECRAEIDPGIWKALMAGFPAHSFLVGLSSVHWREAWKYGERAFRYCQHDVGHALGSMRFAASALGWRLSLLKASDSVVSRVLGLDRTADYDGAEPEHPDLLAVVTPGAWAPPGVPLLPEKAVRELSTGCWYGKANALSPKHGVDWPVIDEVAEAAGSAGIAMYDDFSGFPSEAELFGSPVRSGSFSAERVILTRRSAVSMDAVTSIPAATFYRMLGRLVPTGEPRQMPWDALPWRPRIHLGLFVHRVDGLIPGLYALVRDPAKWEELRAAMRADFLWQRPPGSPVGLSLYLLKAGECRDLAAQLSCGQDIASDGVFSLGMISEFSETLAMHGAACYRHLFWEAGLVGQVLYLEAEEAGIRATGIGCYMDDPVHEVFGITTRQWQSLYHFTVGGPKDDVRLTTLPAYEGVEAPKSS